MKLFVILGPNQNLSADREDILVVRDGFSFLGFLVPPLWFLWRGMWFHAALSLLVFIVVGMIPLELLQFILSFLVALWLGFEAQFFHLEFLQKQGLVVLAHVQAVDSEMARDLYLAEQPKSPIKAANPIPKTKPSSQQADMIFGRS